MNLRLALFIFTLAFYGFGPAASFASDNHVLLEPVAKYSYCTPYGDARYSLGIVGNDWALTFEVTEDSFSGKSQANNASFYRGPGMNIYIGRSAGPRRPPIPNTEAYTKTELTGIHVAVKRIKVYDKVKGTIEVTVNDFTVNSQLFHVTDRVNIVCIGPLP